MLAVGGRLLRNARRLRPWERTSFLSKYGFSAAYAATEPISGLPHKVCNDWFKNLKNNSCVNVDLLATSTADDNLHPSNNFPADSLATSQWCYVPND